MITIERWQTFTSRDQLGHIAAEVLRAKFAKSEPACKGMLERAFELIDLSLADPKWLKNPLPLLVLRAELAKVYLGDQYFAGQSMGLARALDKIVAAI